MSGKKRWQLTKDGVFSLFMDRLNQEIRMQVIFKANIDSMCCLRLSDGVHISPIVYIQAKQVTDKSSVGAIIVIKEREVLPSDPYLVEKNRLEDLGLHYVIITSYKVVASAEAVGRVVGLSNRNVSYRDELRHILPALVQWQCEDDQLRYELENNMQYIKKQQHGEALREEGNRYFNNNEYNDALLFYTMVTREDKYDCRVWSNISQVYYRLGRYQEAEIHAIFAIKMNPFYEKAYYRAALAALRGHKSSGSQYALDGLFMCGNSNELQHILDGDYDNDDVPGAESHLPSAIASTIDICERFRSAKIKDRTGFSDLQKVIHKKKIVELSDAFGREPRQEKAQTKPKKPREEAAGVLPAATTSRKQAKQPREKESKKHVQAMKEEEAAAVLSTAATSEDQEQQPEEEESKKHVQKRRRRRGTRGRGRH